MTIDDSATSEALDVLRVDVVAFACTTITTYTRVYTPYRVAEKSKRFVYSKPWIAHNSVTKLSEKFHAYKISNEVLLVSSLNFTRAFMTMPRALLDQCESTCSESTKV